MHRKPRCIDTSSIAGDNWVHPIVVDIAIKYLAPWPRSWKADAVIEPGTFRQRCDHNDILPRAVEPAMECNYPVLVVNMKCIQVVPTQCWVVPSKTDQILREAQMIDPSRVRSGIQASPQIKFADLGSELHCLSSKNSWPMKICGIPGAVSNSPVANRDRLRAYHDSWSEPSASAGMRGSAPTFTISWFSTQGTACHP